jgi:hypothetical protein
MQPSATSLNPSPPPCAAHNPYQENRKPAAILLTAAACRRKGFACNTNWQSDTDPLE